MQLTQNYVLTLNFVKKKSSTFEKHIDLQSQAIYVDNSFFQE
jgi:hypothetical protein